MNSIVIPQNVSSRVTYKENTRNTTTLLLGLLLLGLCFLVSQSRSAAASEGLQTKSFHARYHGTFTETFGAGPGGTNVLAFQGTGIARHLGASTVTVLSLLQPEPTNPLCSIVVDNQVTLTAANGDEVLMQNTALDCFDPATSTITGTGTYTIIGGTGSLRWGIGHWHGQRHGAGHEYRRQCCLWHL